MWALAPLVGYPVFAVICVIIRHVPRMTPLNQQITDLQAEPRNSQQQDVQAEYSVKEPWCASDPALLLLELHFRRP